MDIQEKIDTIVKNNKVVLMMKGTKQFPQCGFSGRAVELLKACDCHDFFVVNILQDPEMRQGAKEYADWPTFPQLYINGEFIGGADIMWEMYQTGELQQALVSQS
ncbi:MAG: Grx4 family monothiol glutaredoxin [Neisseriaceae bacterium]|nr:Grx4 family monothiol glutaredoxin [Neisseriaceae bacterium]